VALKAARFANLFITGALTGNEFGSWAALHPALRELPHQAHVRSEQAVTRRYGKMMPALMTGALVSFVPVLSLSTDRRRSLLIGLAGMVCYATMLAITLTRNLPINRRTLELNPDTTPREEFLELRARWDRLHTARNALNLAGFGLAILGVLSTDKPARQEDTMT
jgi:anthrone oxygenase-like protein